MMRFQYQFKSTNRAGFTLIETLLVLVLVGIALWMVTIRPMSSFQAPLEERIFFEQLKNEMNYAQEVAILQNMIVEVQFKESGNGIVFGNRILEVPHNWRVGTDFTFRYLPNGRVNGFKAIYFEQTETGQQRQLVMQLGSGKFEIK